MLRVVFPFDKSICNLSNSKQSHFMETIQLTVRKIKFYFSTVNQAELSYFTFTKKLKSTQIAQKHSYILTCGCIDNNIYMIQSTFRLLFRASEIRCTHFRCTCHALMMSIRYMKKCAPKIIVMYVLQKFYNHHKKSLHLLRLKSISGKTFIVSCK